MSVVVRMEMPNVCITENGYCGYCPMDRVLCIQRNAPPDITTGEAYKAMKGKIPSWCPIICQLPEGHGRLVDADAIYKRSNGKYGDSEILAIAMEFYGAPIIVPAERSET